MRRDGETGEKRQVGRKKNERVTKCGVMNRRAEALKVMC